MIVFRNLVFWTVLCNFVLMAMECTAHSQAALPYHRLITQNRNASLQNLSLSQDWAIMARSPNILKRKVLPSELCFPKRFWDCRLFWYLICSCFLFSIRCFYAGPVSVQMPKARPEELRVISDLVININLKLDETITHKREWGVIFRDKVSHNQAAAVVHSSTCYWQDFKYKNLEDNIFL